MTTKVPVELFSAGAGFTVGDGTAEDIKIVFDGNAEDYYIGLDDSADKLIIGVGSTVGTTPTITIDESQNFEIAGTMNLLGFTGSKANFTNSMLISQNASTGTLSTANNNTGFGHNVFAALTTGDGNTALGADVLGVNTSGVNNTGVGLDALKALTAGDRNTVVGSTAADATTTGSQNTAVGYGALSSNTTASANTAVGDSSLELCTTGHSNTAVGEDAGKAITTGFQCVAIGQKAGSALTTSQDSIMIGHDAGKNITTGVQNICIGTDTQAASAGGHTQIVMGISVQGNANSSFVFGDGSNDCAIAFGGNSITNPSDERVKEDIQDSSAGLSFIKDLRPVTFRYRKEKDIPNELNAYKEGSEKRAVNEKVNHGFIAQEVKAVIDAHNEIKDGIGIWQEDESDGRQRLGITDMETILVKAVQELSEKCDSLQNEINELKGN